MNVVEEFWTADVSDYFAEVPGQSLVFGDGVLNHPTEDRSAAAYSNSAPYTRLVLNWQREDRRQPGVVGSETLRLDLRDFAPGNEYVFPSVSSRAEYAMATPSKGQGAKAISLTGRVYALEMTPKEVVVEVDLVAKMQRVDRDVIFTEAIQGSFRVSPQHSTER